MPVRRTLKTVSAFFHHEAAGGIVLLVAAILAMLVKNSGLAHLYDEIFEFKVGPEVGSFSLYKPLHLWINDGLMAVFFFLVGLEIKREMLVGELSSFGRAVLPGIAAVGGMLVPSLIYIGINWHNATALRGWAIPAATDIAFAVGILALIGPRVPSSLKVFLLALAILDDLGAILIIALFYTASLNLFALALAAAACAILLLLNRRNVQSLWPYLIVGLFIWVCVLKSGLHATLAGVVVALFVPLDSGSEDESKLSLLERLEEALHAPVAFFILPLFAFSNAGVSLAGMTLDKLFSSVPMGIALGLLLGKPIGIFLATWLSVTARIAPKPEGASWVQVLGAGLLGGIGFTMSLFIGMLAFTDAERAAELRLGVLAGSLLAATLGYLLLTFTSPPSPRPERQG
ncbi:MAG: Na+/H+ antiporter NhaA [Hyphomicrobiales bacterium]|nr:MAG: Na+/H+ antiporter NhaA [Hyphomicrobiales bacterium]